MPTALEGCITEEQRSVMFFFFVCGQKDSMQRIFMKKYFISFIIVFFVEMLRITPGMSFCVRNLLIVSGLMARLLFTVIITTHCPSP
jgi:hypothetical protein